MKNLWKALNLNRIFPFICSWEISDISESQHNYNSTLIIGTTINNINWWCMIHSQFYLDKIVLATKFAKILCLKDYRLYGSIQSIHNKMTGPLVTWIKQIVMCWKYSTWDGALYQTQHLALARAMFATWPTSYTILSIHHS